MANDFGMSPWGTVGAGLLGGLGIGNLFMGQKDYKDPSKAAMPFLNQLAPLLQKYYGPYAQMGQQLTPQMQQLYQGMLNPGQLMQQLGGGYKQSPGYQFQLNQGLDAAKNAAAAGGMLGTGMHQQQAAGVAENLANQDYNQYLQNALGIYGGGVGGIGKLQQQGFGAGTDLAQNLAQALMSQAQMRYAGQANVNNMQQQQRAAESSGLFNMAGMLPLALSIFGL